jgi:uncharacterized protein YciI
LGQKARGDQSRVEVRIAQVGARVGDPIGEKLAAGHVPVLHEPTPTARAKKVSRIQKFTEKPSGPKRAVLVVGVPDLGQARGMFVIELVYKADLREIDAHMGAHVAFLKKYYASGHFLVSGRKIPRDGGIILAVGKSREQIDGIIREDPFHKLGLAEFRIIEFRASQRADDIQKRIDG